MATGAVTGLASEAAIARRLGMLAAAGAATPKGTEAAIASLIRQGVPGLISFGVAGGLARDLEPGTLLLPSIVRTGSGDVIWVDVEWHGRLGELAREAGLSPVVLGGILGVDRIAATVAEKERLFRESGALAVDLESHRVAVAATRARLPFVVLRAVADPAGRELPPAALVPLTREGRPSPLRITASLARVPSQFSGLLQLRRDADAALGALERAGRALGPSLSRLEHAGG